MKGEIIPQNYEPPKENYPYPAPFLLSSVERSWCINDPARVVYIKRSHLEQNLLSLGDVMDETERKKFLDHWCSPSTRDRSTIRAELDPCFNLRQRAENWMEKARPDKRQQPKSRLERYAESARQFIEQETCQTISPTDPVPRGYGYADIPDEQ